MKTLTLPIIWISFLTLFGSWAFDVSFAFSFAFVTVFLSIGHVISMDDDLKGGWNNPDGDRNIINRSICELLLKVIFSIITWWAVLSFPELSEYGL
jgi:predicted membrane metal-binding protein